MEGLLPRVTIDKDGLMSKLNFGLLTKHKAHTGKDVYYKFTKNNEANGYREFYKIYVVDSATEKVTNVYRYGTGVQIKGNAEIYKDNEGFLYVKQAAYTPVSVVPIITNGGAVLEIASESVIATLVKIEPTP